MLTLMQALPGKKPNADPENGVGDGNEPLPLRGQNHGQNERDEAENHQQIAHFLLG